MKYYVESSRHIIGVLTTSELFKHSSISEFLYQLEKCIGNAYLLYIDDEGLEEVGKHGKEIKVMGGRRRMQID